MSNCVLDGDNDVSMCVVGRLTSILETQAVDDILHYLVVHRDYERSVCHQE